VQAVLNDLSTAPISERDRALYAFIAKANADSTSIHQSDVDVVRAAGWSDEALYDAITVHALFRFYNTWIDATGVSDMPAFAYEMSGKRLATVGYDGDVRETVGGGTGNGP
jgi:hypothetical protein